MLHQFLLFILLLFTIALWAEQETAYYKIIIQAKTGTIPIESFPYLSIDHQTQHCTITIPLETANRITEENQPFYDFFHEIPNEVRLDALLKETEYFYKTYEKIIYLALEKSREYHPFPGLEECPYIRQYQTMFHSFDVIPILEQLIENQWQLESCLQDYLHALEQRDIPVLIKDYKANQYFELYNQALYLTDKLVMDKSTALRIQISFKNSLAYCGNDYD